ncbi:MAG TPA: hypothetical protein RMI62_03300, partial [Polyangiaceae bacterium LLY-WYZ-15_(1-7)]|nr:hypothetical protein [Polyangiaceae bacterium LLY-WYZ-15_(1-7)]
EDEADDEPTLIRDIRSIGEEEAERQLRDELDRPVSTDELEERAARIREAGGTPKGGVELADRKPGEMPIIFRAKGCEECSFTGYRGRMGIFELMLIDADVRAEILKQSDSKTIGQAAQRNGMRVLREDGARQVLAGVTSVEEVLAATQANEMEAAE